MSSVGKKFPNIEVNAMSNLGDIFKINMLNEAVSNKKKVLLFWYLKDFTFVCPTELHAFQEALAELGKHNVKVIGASCNTAEVHFAWLNTSKDNGSIEGVTYPILAGNNHNLARTLGIPGSNGAHDEVADAYLLEGDDVTFRAIYLIGETGKVFHEGINDMPLGHNAKEYLRLVDAYTHVQQHGEVCPANWEEGKDMMNADHKGVASYLTPH